MAERPSVIERAFQIAKSGKVADMPALHKQLLEEGYATAAQALAGRSLVNQLGRMMAEARTPRTP